MKSAHSLILSCTVSLRAWAENAKRPRASIAVQVSLLQHYPFFYRSTLFSILSYTSLAQNFSSPGGMHCRMRAWGPRRLMKKSPSGRSILNTNGDVTSRPQREQIVSFAAECLPQALLSSFVVQSALFWRPHPRTYDLLWFCHYSWTTRLSSYTESECRENSDTYSNIENNCYYIPV